MWASVCSCITAFVFEAFSPVFGHASFYPHLVKSEYNGEVFIYLLIYSFSFLYVRNDGITLVVNLKQ